MSREVELYNFVEKAKEVIESNYILAEIKIVNLLKAIAGSETILALFKNCLTDFDYENAKNKYFVKSEYLSNDKKVYVAPENKKDIIAFVFMNLMDIDNKKITLPDFLNAYFYGDGSTFSSYSLFIDQMIKPFVSTVKELTEDIIGGKIQDPNEALNILKEKKEKEEAEIEAERQKQNELAKKTYGANMAKVRRILLESKKKYLSSNKSEVDKAERVLVVDKFLNALDKQNAEDITYAFLCYQYMAKSHIFKRDFKIGQIRRLLSDIVYEL